MGFDEALVEAPAHSDVEGRSLVIGRLGDKQLSAVIACRGNVIRLTDVRRARSQEVAIYEGE